ALLVGGVALRGNQVGGLAARSEVLLRKAGVAQWPVLSVRRDRRKAIARCERRGVALGLRRDRDPALTLRLPCRARGGGSEGGLLPGLPRTGHLLLCEVVAIDQHERRVIGKVARRETRGGEFTRARRGVLCGAPRRRLEVCRRRRSQRREDNCHRYHSA